MNAYGSVSGPGDLELHVARADSSSCSEIVELYAWVLSVGNVMGCFSACVFCCSKIVSSALPLLLSEKCLARILVVSWGLL